MRKEGGREGARLAGRKNGRSQEALLRGQGARAQPHLDRPPFWIPELGKKSPVTPIPAWARPLSHSRLPSWAWWVSSGLSPLPSAPQTPGRDGGPLSAASLPHVSSSFCPLSPAKTWGPRLHARHLHDPPCQVYTNFLNRQVSSPQAARSPVPEWGCGCHQGVGLWLFPLCSPPLSHLEGHRQSGIEGDILYGNGENAARFQKQQGFTCLCFSVARGGGGQAAPIGAPSSLSDAQFLPLLKEIKKRV